MYTRIMSMILASLWLIILVSSSQSSINGSGNFREDILAAHNKYRADLNIAPLIWSDELATRAQSWANNLASLGGMTLKHNPQDTEGENLWLGLLVASIIPQWSIRGEMRNGFYQGHISECRLPRWMG